MEEAHPEQRKKPPQDAISFTIGGKNNNISFSLSLNLIFYVFCAYLVYEFAGDYIIRILTMFTDDGELVTHKDLVAERVLLLPFLIIILMALSRPLRDLMIATGILCSIIFFTYGQDSLRSTTDNLLNKTQHFLHIKEEKRIRTDSVIAPDKDTKNSHPPLDAHFLTPEVTD